MKNKEHYTDNELDELFSQKLKNHQTQPSAAAWDKLNGKLGKPKRLRRVLWLWLLLLATVSASGGGLWYYTSGIQKQEQITGTALHTEKVLSEEKETGNTPRSNSSSDTESTLSNLEQITSAEEVAEEIISENKKVYTSEQKEAKSVNKVSESNSEINTSKEAINKAAAEKAETSTEETKTDALHSEEKNSSEDAEKELSAGKAEDTAETVETKEESKDEKLEKRGKSAQPQIKIIIKPGGKEHDPQEEKSLPDSLKKQPRGFLGKVIKGVVKLKAADGR